MLKLSQSGKARSLGLCFKEVWDANRARGDRMVLLCFP